MTQSAIPWPKSSVLACQTIISPPTQPRSDCFRSPTPPRPPTKWCTRTSWPGSSWATAQKSRPAFPNSSGATSNSSTPTATARSKTRHEPQCAVAAATLQPGPSLVAFEQCSPSPWQGRDIAPRCPRPRQRGRNESRPTCESRPTLRRNLAARTARRAIPTYRTAVARPRPIGWGEGRGGGSPWSPRVIAKPSLKHYATEESEQSMKSHFPVCVDAFPRRGDQRRIHSRLAVGLTLGLALLAAASQAATSPGNAPPLPLTGTRIVKVATEPELQSAMSNLLSGDTILLDRKSTRL